jgi:LytS/YehU family sensor histidine kinase
VHLQKLRKAEQYDVSLSCTASVRGFSIEPLLLIPFVENAFKHVSAFTDLPNFIRIRLDHKNDMLLFTVENTREERLQVEGYGGIGLKNVQRRLELLYPGKHALKIDRTDKTYHISLDLQTTQTAQSHLLYNSPL